MHYSLSININTYCIVMIMVHRNYIRAEKKKWKAALEINMLVKMINAMTRRKLNRTDSYLLQLIIHNWNLLTKLSLFLCSTFTVSLLYENILSQKSQSTLSSLYRRGLNPKLGGVFMGSFWGGGGVKLARPPLSKTC